MDEPIEQLTGTVTNNNGTTATVQVTHDDDSVESVILYFGHFKNKKIMGDAQVGCQVAFSRMKFSKSVIDKSATVTGGGAALRPRVHDKGALDTKAKDCLKGSIDAGMPALTQYATGQGCSMLMTAIDRTFAHKMIARLRKGRCPFARDALNSGDAQYKCQWFVVYGSNPYIGATAGSRNIRIPTLLLKDGEVRQYTKYWLYSLFEHYGGKTSTSRLGETYALTGSNYPGSAAAEKQMWLAIDEEGVDKGVVKVTLTACTFSMGNDGTFYVVSQACIHMLHIPGGEATIKLAMGHWSDNDEKAVKEFESRLK